MRLRYILYSLLTILIIGAASIFIYRYMTDQNSQPNPSPSTPTQPAKPEDNAPAPQPAKTYPVKIYFSKHPESDNDPSKVFPVSRTSPTIGVGSFAVKELLKGPTEAEKSAKYFSTIRLRNDESNCGGQDFTLQIKDGVATLRFCRTFDHLGSVADGQADVSIKTTLKQFDTVDRVVILNKNNHCEFDLSGMDLCKETDR